MISAITKDAIAGGSAAQHTAVRSATTEDEKVGGSAARAVAVRRVRAQHVMQRKKDAGSTLPLLLGIFLLVLSIFMISVNIFALRAAKMNLEILGEDLLSNVYQDIDYQEYFFGNSLAVTTNTRSWLPFACEPLVLKISEAARNLSRSTRMERVECKFGRLELLLSDEVQLPFKPGFLSNVRPIVFATVSGGVQRVR